MKVTDIMFSKYTIELNELTVLLDKIASFHGHYCPGIAYGLRASLAGLRIIGAKENCDLNILAGTGKCPLDAIQVITGCTIGNGRLKLDEQDRHDFSFWNCTQNRGVLLELKKVAYQKNTSETGVTVLPVDEVKTRKTWKNIDIGLKEKMKHILSAKEEDVVILTPLYCLPESFR